MTDEMTGQTEATPRELKPSELLRQRLRLTDEERAEIDARLNDPNRTPRKVEWLGAGCDPLGMDWEWLKGSEPETPSET